MEKLAVIVQIAFHNLFASRLKTLIVGGIVFFGAVLVVVGGSLLGSVDSGMSRSIVGAAAGNIQVYSSKSKDELAIWGQMGGDPDLAEIEDFTRLEASLEKVPNVKAVVPMGISSALVTSGNTIDIALEKLRAAMRRLKAGDTSPDAQADYAAQKAHVRHMVSVLEGDRKNLKVLASDAAVSPDDVADLAMAASPTFWASFDQDLGDAAPYQHQELLENKIAPQATDADLIYLRYIGTDMDDFQRSFDRMEIVDGTRVPEGKPGFLFAKHFYEDALKLKSAHRLDQIKEARRDAGRTIAADPALQRLVKQNESQVQEIVLQLDEIRTQEAVSRLQKALGSSETDLGALLTRFFDTTDQNFDARYGFFYQDLAPLLDLYRVRIGDALTIKAYTKTGYVRSVNLTVYGTFQFKGLEKSALAGSLNLMDLMSFRELYGFSTNETRAELAKMKAQAAVAEVSREQAEDQLFGGGGDGVAEAKPGVIDVSSDLQGMAKALREKDLASRTFTREQEQRGAVLDAAVFLKDPARLAQSIKDIEAQTRRDGLAIKAVSWQKASGLIGQFVLMMRLVLYVTVLIIFSVALVIINNSMVMATLERVREIGTLRAIGAQRRFLLQMLFVEAVVVGAVFGGLGALLGAGIIKLIAMKGIPATTDAMFFFFSGPRLRPLLAGSNLVWAFAIVLAVSALSSFYPAWLAMRVSPLQAMQTED